MNDEMEAKTETSENSAKLGCDHYQRKCIFISPCCQKEYPCRVCHDDKENHQINRRAVQEVRCLVCNFKQKVQQKCESCDVVMGKYFCSMCRLFDDKDKGQFHCDGCGLCRVGGQENFFHCQTCDMCLAVNLKDNHKCVQESSRRNCAVCLEDLHTSRTDAHIPSCGHLIHRVCYMQCLKSGNYACPTCAQSLVDMKGIWSHLDEEVANTPMPDEYKDHMVNILCRDCHLGSKVKFHVIGMKCMHCGSYNTCNSSEEEVNATNKGSAESQDKPPKGAS